MKITNQLSIATLVLAGVFATGCSQQQSAGGSQVSGGSQQSAGGSQVSGGSQQSAGGSQVSGGSQQSAGGSQVSGGSQQSAGGSQVSGGSQQSGSQQQVKEAPPAVDNKQQQPPAVVKAPPVRPPVRHTNRWTHSHPAQPNCTKSVTHTHKYGNAGHRHTYSCSRPAAKQQRRQPPVDVFALQRKLKAKGYYKGPIDGIVGPGTRSALQRFMKR